MADNNTSTLVHILSNQAKKYGDGRTAIRYLKDGKWASVSWKGYLNNVQAFAYGIKELGFGAGDKLSLMSTNCPQWLYADLATMALGGATVAIYPNYTDDQVKYIVEHSESKILVVENKAILDVVRGIIPEIDCLKHVIVIDDKGAEGDIKSFDSVMLTGADAIKKDDGGWQKVLDDLDPKSLATIQYTSGTTGPPKGAMLSHANLVAMADGIIQVFNMREEETISFLPLSHIAERLQGMCASVYAANQVTFARSLETLKEDLVMVRPTVLTCVPRLYEKFYAGITENVTAAGGIKEKLFSWSLAVGGEVSKLRNSGNKKPGLGLSIKWAIANKLVVSKLKAKLGMDRCRMFVSGAAPLSPKVSAFFAALGMDILEVYGQTECTGVCTMNPQYGLKVGTVGKTVPGQEVKIAEDGEVLVKGANVMMGYYKNEEATAEALSDGWLHTGDVGEFDSDGYLKITDRKKDIIVTAGGKNVSPQNIENILKTYPGISQAVVIGDQRKYLTALVTLDADAMPAVCKDAGFEFPKENAHEDERVIGLIQKYFDEVNQDLARYETIKYIRLLDHDFSVESGEMTPSLKVKRRVVQKNYVGLIDEMYGEKAE